MQKIKNSTFSKVIYPEIETLATEILAIEAKLGQSNEKGYLKAFCIYKSDIPLTLSEIDEVTFTELVLFFKETEMYCDFEAENAIDFKDENASRFCDYITYVETVYDGLIERIFGNNIFDKFDYSKKDSEQAKDYIEIYGSIPDYAVTEIDTRNKLIQKLAELVNQKLLNKPFSKYYISSAMDGPSNAVEHIDFWISVDTMVAICTYWYL